MFVPSQRGAERSLVSFDSGSYLFHSCDIRGLIPMPRGSSGSWIGVAVKRDCGWIEIENRASRGVRQQSWRMAAEGTVFSTVWELGQRKPW